MSRREPKPIDAGPGWLATYGDLVTLLLAFFVMMFAVSSVQEQKFEAFLSGLGHFDNSAAEPGVWPQSANSATEMAVGPEVGVAAAKQRAAARAASEEQAEIDEIARQISEAVKAGPVPSAVEVYIDERGVAAVLSADDLLFASGSAELTASGIDVLARMVAILRPLPYDVTVEGHTDDVPLNRSGYTNWNLSTDRAVSVVHEFTIAHGLEPARFSAVGHAENKPRVVENTPAARARNRRVEIIVHAPGGAPSPPPDPAPAPTTTIGIRVPAIDVVTGRGLPTTTKPEQKG